MKRLLKVLPRHNLPRLFTAAQSELGAVAALAVMATGVLASLDISEDMAEGETHAFDLRVLQALRAPGDPHVLIGPKWLHIGAVDITSLGSVAVLGLIVILSIALMLTLKRWSEAVMLLVGAVGGVEISQGLKHIFERARPDLDYRAVEAFNASFPSGHAMLSAVVYLTLGTLAARFAQKRRVKVLVMMAAVLLTLLVGCSRIYLGVHWTSDVLAGWSMGAAWAMLCWLAAWAWERRTGVRLDRPAEAR
jgi:undecaprenyl-diphosphatase